LPFFLGWERGGWNISLLSFPLFWPFFLVTRFARPLHGYFSQSFFIRFTLEFDAFSLYPGTKTSTDPLGIVCASLPSPSFVFLFGPFSPFPLKLFSGHPPPPLLEIGVVPVLSDYQEEQCGLIDEFLLTELLPLPPSQSRRFLLSMVGSAACPLAEA